MQKRSILVLTLVGTLIDLGAASQAAQICSTQIDIGSAGSGGKQEDLDSRRVSADIDTIFAAALREAQKSASLDPYHQIVLLGTLALYDKNLSVDKNLACTSCHVKDTGFTGGVSLFNQTIVAHPGSVANPAAKPPAPNVRIAARKPQSYAYAPFSPILEYDATQRQFVGGNFWDMRATGGRLGNPAAEQAQGPPTNPLEMGLSDTACVVHRLSQGSYRAFFEQLWGAQSFAISWPANVEAVCATPGPPPDNDPLPVHLSAVDRGTSNSTFDHFAMSIAAAEASPDTSPFSSKFDYALSHPEQKVLSEEELAGWRLFRGKAQCNTCHVDGTQNAATDAGKSASGTSSRTFAAGDTNRGPLFTDFQTHNLGVPANPALPYYCESVADQRGYVANPQGRNYLDRGAGGFLASSANPNREWAQYAPGFNGRFQTPTLRNVDKRPRPDFVKAYMHNGYLKSLKDVVHFYNTRDALPRCKDPLDFQAGKTCWPAPEVSDNVATSIGNLHLSNREEDDLVAFLKTLTDGYVRVAAPGDAIGASIGGGSAGPSP